MSLFFWRGRIVRAIAGELSAQQEAKLRSHLVRCDACRTYYDKVSITAEVIGPRGTTASQRERRRLLSMIGASLPLDPTESKRVTALTQRRWGMVLAPTLAIAGFAIWMNQGDRFNAEPADVSPGAFQWRGAQDNLAPETSFRVLIHARRKSIDGGTMPAVRLVAEFPGSGEARLSLEDFVQFSYRGLQERSFFVLVGLRSDGTVVPIIPGEGVGSIRIESTNRTTGIGPSLDLRDLVPSGTLQLLGIISAKKLPDSQIRGTIAAWQRKTSPPAAIEIVSGLLIVEP
jgi:hypothetical protein